MTTGPTRFPHPAATMRTGAGRPALPPDPGLDPLLADPRLGSTAKTIAVALVKQWARFKDHAWPSDKTIGKAIGKSPGHVQRCLRELERLGYIRREATPDVPNGRRLWLLWRAPGMSAGAQPASAPARSHPPAPARDKEVVVVNRENEPEANPAPSRSRPEAAPTEATPLPSARPPIAPVLVPALAPAPVTPRRKLELSLAELVNVVVATADPILAAELARRTAPPPPPEPPPQALPTPELLRRLPGRHDLVGVAAQRLCQDLEDFKAATWSFVRKALESVAARVVPASVLLDCFRQATGPQARDRGKVFVTAWKREGRASPG